MEKTFYTKQNKCPHFKKVWLYINYFEQWNEKYLFDEKALIFIVDNLEFNNITLQNSKGKFQFRKRRKK